jgi:hypothetical protein
MTNKYHSDTQEKIDTIIYNPTLQDSGNLAVETGIITATSKPVTTDYSASLITINPSDSRLKVRRLCQRLNIHIDSFSGEPAATKLCYSVEVNGIERAGGEFTAAGADNLIAWDLTDGQFNLGVANTIDVFLWVDRGTAEISVVQLWQGVGTCTTGWFSFPIEVYHKGLAQVSANFTRVGTGTPGCNFMPLGSVITMSESLQNDISSKLSIVNGIFTLRLKGTVSTDLNCIQILNISLKKSQ